MATRLKIILTAVVGCAVFPLTEPPRTEPTPAPPQETYIHVWAVPADEDVGGTWIVWTFGPRMEWQPGWVRPAWNTPHQEQEPDGYWGLVCRDCQRQPWACCRSNAVWPEAFRFEPGFGVHKSYCRDAVWLGQVRERDWQAELLRRARAQATCYRR